MDDAVEKVTPEQSKLEEERLRIQRYHQRFRKAQTGLGGKHSLWKQLDVFDRGRQWDDVSAPPWIPKPVTNLIRFVRTLKRANLASAIPTCTFSAEFAEDIQTIWKLQKAYEHVWERDAVARTVRRCIDRAVLQGTAIAYVYEDDLYVGGKYFGENDERNHLYRGDIKVKRFPNTNFFPDPDAYRLEQCKYIETTEILPLSQIKNTPAFKKHAGKKLSQLKSNYLDHEDGADGTIMTRDNHPNGGSPVVTGDELVTLHTHWERYVNDEGRWQLDVTYYIRNAFFELLRIEDVKPSEYPFAVLYDEEEEQDFWGTSICMDAMENQKILSKVSQTASIIGMLHQNPQKVVSRESGINGTELARTGTLPGKVWTANGDPSKAIHHLEPPNIPKELFDLKQDIQSDIKDMAGISEAYTGQSVGSLTTSTGVDSLIERATIRDKDKMIQIDEFVERISHLIVQFIIHKWDRARPIAQRQPNGSMTHDQWEPIDEITAKNLEWRVRSDVYAKAPTTQAQRRQQADNLMQMQGQFQFSPAIITPEEWIQLQDFDIKDQILARMQNDRKMAEQQAQQQPAKIPLGDVKVSLGSSDPNVILEYLQQLQQEQTVNMQIQSQIQSTHAQPALPSLTGEQGGQASAPQDPQAPQGVTGALQMNKMARGM